MYLKLGQKYFVFEKVFDLNDDKYFNIKDYQIYSVEARQEFINAEIYEANDFLLIPQIERNDIVLKYLVQKNNHTLIRKREVKDFFGEFHVYIEDNLLTDDWNDYEKSELIKFGSTWCEQNQIIFTIKGNTWD